MKVLEEIPQDQIECIEACRKINNRFHEKEGWHSHTTFIECRVIQNCLTVYLRLDCGELILHHPENDERPYDEDRDVYQPWFTYLREQLKYKIEEISTVKF